jgi:hypothetical protein
MIASSHLAGTCEEANSSRDTCATLNKRRPRKNQEKTGRKNINEQPAIHQLFPTFQAWSGRRESNPRSQLEVTMFSGVKLGSDWDSCSGHFPDRQRKMGPDCGGPAREDRDAIAGQLAGLTELMLKFATRSAGIAVRLK